MDRTINVNADALARLLQGSEGFWETELGVGWTDDGSGTTRRLTGLDCPFCVEAKKKLADEQAASKVYARS